MANDIGMIKSVVGAGSPSGPVNPTARGDPAGKARQEAQAAARVEPQSPVEDLDEMVSDLNSLVRELHRELRFSVDRDSGETVIKVVDQKTDEVVRQIPSEELMRLRKRLEEAAGVIFQGSA